MRTAEGPHRLGTIEEVPLPGVAAELLGKVETRCYRAASGCSIMVGREPNRQAPGDIWLPPDELLLWHLSIAHPERYPSWDEVAEARYELVPEEITMAMLLPPPELYLNEHPYCFHLWQIDDRRAGP
jgi:hypothetical protein